jgi:hypothetical protein
MLRLAVEAKDVAINDPPHSPAARVCESVRLLAARMVKHSSPVTDLWQAPLGSISSPELANTARRVAAH